MKKLLKSVLDRLLLGLPERLAFRMLSVLCERYRIRTVVMETATGGLIEGSLKDLGMFGRLLRFGWYGSNLPDEKLAQSLKNSPHGTYIDIGANIGTTTIPLALAHDWEFHAFEPDPENFLRLQCNLVRNKLERRVKTYNCALSDAPGKILLKRSPHNFGDYRLNLGTSAMESDQWSAVEVNVRTLDDLLSETELARPIVVKIDTQGSEPFVFRGGKSVLSKADVIALEFWPRVIAKMGNDPIDFFDCIADVFANAEGFGLNRAWLTKQAIRLRIQEVIDSKTDEYVDLVLSKRDELS